MKMKKEPTSRPRRRLWKMCESIDGEERSEGRDQGEREGYSLQKTMRDEERSDREEEREREEEEKEGRSRIDDESPPSLSLSLLPSSPLLPFTCRMNEMMMRERGEEGREVMGGER